MNVFLVTKSAHFYPCDATYDWQEVTTDPDVAEAAFEAAVEEARDAGGYTVCLIEVLGREIIKRERIE